MTNKNLIINITILMIVSLTLFAIFEISLRIFYPQLTTQRGESISPKIFENSDYTPWKLKPNTVDRQISGVSNEFDVEIRINSEGLRDDEITETDEIIMSAIGDSFTYGYGIELEDIYHQKLESMLDVRIINMGRADGSLSTDVQYLYLKEKGLEFNPTIIILGFYVGNDITDIGTKTQWLSIDENGNPTNITTNFTYIDEKGRYRRIYDRKEVNSPNKFMSRYSHAYMLLKRFAIGFLINPEPNHLFYYSEEYQKKLEVSKRMLFEIDKLLKSNNSTLVVMFIPTKAQVDDKAWESYRKYFGDNSNRFNPQSELMFFCDENKIRCLNLLPSFMGKSKLYFDIDNHWNEAGHELAAKKLYEYLTI